VGIERHRRSSRPSAPPRGRPAVTSWIKSFESWTKASAAEPGRRHMRVKLCARCPYTPHDLADHYDPDAALHACAKCDGEVGILNACGPRRAERRQQCSTSLDIISMTTPGVAPFATDGLASSATTHGGLPSVPKSASIASGHAGRVTAIGCADFAPPDYGLRETTGASRRAAFRSGEAGD
jgi:hypothetical protein